MTGINRAVASLTVPGGQEFYFPHFFLKSRLSFLIFPQTFTHFLPHFGPPGGRVAHPERPWLRHWVSRELLFTKFVKSIKKQYIVCGIRFAQKFLWKSHDPVVVQHVKTSGVARTFGARGQWTLRGPSLIHTSQPYPFNQPHTNIPQLPPHSPLYTFISTDRYSAKYETFYIISMIS